MKVRILTYHFSINVGSLLQAYALRRWFQVRGHDAALIPYHPPHQENGLYDRPWDPRKLGRNAMVAYLKGASLHRRLFGNRQWLAELNAFRREQLGVTGPEAGGSAELQDCDPGDLLVCGSDTIWDPTPQYGLDPVYFLAFPGADRARRISYAASFARNALAPNFHAEVAALLAPLDAISVRERSGARIVSEVAGRAAAVAPDPTILHGDFGALLPKDPAGSGGHVFAYSLRSTGVIREVAAEISATVRGPVLSPRNPHAPWRTLGKAIDAGPLTWLQLLITSRFAVTNSFHGVTMSILLHRPFIAVGLPGAQSSFGERYIDLMALTGLSDRLVLQPDPANIRRLVEQPIDWDAVDAKLAELRSAGAAFLDTQLGLAAAGAGR